MPNRIIKESVCTSDSIDSLTWFEEVLFYRLIVNCDDYGRFDGRTAVIKNRLFPLKENLTLKAVSDAINKLASCGLVVLYSYEDKPYVCLPTWNEHQNVRAKQSKYPAPDDNVNTNEYKCMQMYSSAGICSRNPIQSESESESNASNIRAHARGAIPTKADVEKYISENPQCEIDVDLFFDHYSAVGWQIQGEPVKDWRALVRKWRKVDEQNGKIYSKPSFDVEEAFAASISRAREKFMEMRGENNEKP